MSLFNNDDAFIKAYNKALNLLNHSINTEFTLKLKLKKKNISDKIINQVIEKLKEENLLNDYEYAKIYAENLAKYKKTGPNKIFIKLKEKGISKNDSIQIIKEIIEKIGGEEKLLEKCLEKNYKNIRKKINNKGKDKIKSRLYLKGFNVNVINRVINNLNDYF
jgi:regulatory protein